MAWNEEEREEGSGGDGDWVRKNSKKLRAFVAVPKLRVIL